MKKLVTRVHDDLDSHEDHCNEGNEGNELRWDECSHDTHVETFKQNYQFLASRVGP